MGLILTAIGVFFGSLLVGAFLGWVVMKIVMWHFGNQE